jgi:low affinity Fe/Cu permease
VPSKTLRQRFYELGCRLSDRGADVAGHPNAIVGVLLACTAAFLLLGEEVALNLTLALSVLAITLTQMVLNQQKRHEAALHLKIDELIHAMKGARDDLMGIEHSSEAELEALRIKGDIAEEVLEKRRTGRATTAEQPPA